MDPNPALRLLLDLPLRTPVEADVSEALGRVDQTIRKGGAAWPAVYQDALGIAERIVAECDRRIDDVQRKSMAIEEAAERARSQQGPRRQLDTVRNELRQVASQLKQDWRGRLQRQQEQLQSKAVEAMATLTLEVKQEGEKAEARAAEAWLLQLASYVEKLAREWRGQVAEALPASISAKATAALASLKELSLGPVPPTAAPPLTMVDSVKLSSPPQSFDVPAFGTALAQYARGHLMTASMMGTMLFAAFAAVVSMGGHGGAGSSSMYARGWVLLIALPPSVIFGAIAAKRSRQVALEKGRDQKKQAIVSALTQDIQKLLARVQGELERACAQAIDTAMAQLEGWLTQSSQAAITRLEAAQQEQLRAQKLEVRALQDRASEARTLKSQLSQAVLPELRRRLRDLTAAPAAT